MYFFLFCLIQSGRGPTIFFSRFVKCNLKKSISCAAMKKKPNTRVVYIECSRNKLADQVGLIIIGAARNTLMCFYYSSFFVCVIVTYGVREREKNVLTEGRFFHTHFLFNQDRGSAFI